MLLSLLSKLFILSLISLCHADYCRESEWPRNDPKLQCEGFCRPASCYTTIENFKGEILTESDGAVYNEARLGWNTAIVPSPIIIAQVANYEDVRRAVLHARKCCFKITVRSGGHSLSNFGEFGDLVVDVRSLRNIAINTNDETATVQVGNRFQSIVDVLASTPYYVIAGSCLNVSISGYMVSGGLGVISRQKGLAVDNLISAKMMMANGELVEITSKSHPDLFWAMSGGGGSNFGISLEFTFKIFKKPTDLFLYVTVIFSLENAPQAISSISKFFPQDDNDRSKDKLSFFSFFTRFPQVETGLQTYICFFFYNGDPVEGQQLLDTLYPTLPPNITTITELRTWPEVQANAQSPFRIANNGKTAYLTPAHLTVEQATLLRDTYVLLSSDPIAPLSVVDLYLYAGAIGRQDSSRVSFPKSRRKLRFITSQFQLFTDPSITSEQIVQARARLVQAFELTKSFQDMSRIGNQYGPVQSTYAGYQDLTLDSNDWPAAYYAENFKRLAELKRRFDPNLIFTGYPQAIGNQPERRK